MSKEDDLYGAFGLIYEAVLDEGLWPKGLTLLADIMGTAQIGLCAMDRRAKTFHSIVPRTDPDWDARYKQYWAFRNPLWTLSTKRPAKEVYFLDDLIPRDDFTATPVYNEWWRPAGFGLGNMAANLHVGGDASALIFIVNAPDKEQITAEQAQIFKTILPHVDRAVRIHRELRIRDLDLDSAPERLDHADLGVMLVDRSAQVLFANRLARALLGSSGGLRLHAGRLESTKGSGTLQRLIASCDQKLCAPQGPGGEIVLFRDKCLPLRVTVTPLRSRGTVAELPWLGLQLPVAMVTLSNPAFDIGRSGTAAMQKWPN
jgi:PAS domain-containing protein